MQSVIDFGRYRRKEKTLQELAADLGPQDLARLTTEMCHQQLRLIAGARDADVTLVPEDPEANDTFAAREEDRSLAWTLGHVVVHATASSEEAAAHALTLARGLQIEGRSRYEVPWQEVGTAEFLRRRIQESLRMRLRMLEAWPDQPHLDVLYRPAPERPEVNAVGRFLSGLAHDDSHLEQIRRILSQAQRV